LALVEGGLHEVSHVLEAHLDACETCRALVVALAGTSDTTHEERYVVRGECGRGGQSRVLRVYDRHMKREVALKEFQGGEPGQVSAVDRCLREIWAAGAVSHPAVLPPHEVGVRPDGAAFYTMPLVEGRTLGKVVEATPRLADRLRLVPNIVQVAQALASAHARGFVHRDVKPSNVMVGGFGETRVLDWGLARAAAPPETGSVEHDTEEMGSTREGTILGTPAYMSPEQADGRSDLVGPRSDVWSLGALLFFVLTGKPPFAGASTEAVLDAVREGRRAPLRSGEGEVPPELAAIVERAMSPDPFDRYVDGEAFAEDLQAFLSGAPVRAYAYRTRDRVRRFARRNRALLLGFTAVSSTLALGLASTAILWQREASARARADHALALAQEAHEHAERAAARAEVEALSAAKRLAVAEIDTSERLREDGRVLRSVEMATRAMIDDPPSTTESSVAFHVIPRTRGMRLLLQLDPVLAEESMGTASTGAPAMSIALAGPWLAETDGGAEVHVRKRDDGTSVSLPGHDDALDVVLSADGRYAATRDRKDDLRVWSLPEGKLQGVWPETSPRYVSIDVADTGVVAYIDPQQRVRIADPRTPTATPRTLSIEQPFSVKFEPGGAQLAVGTTDGRVVLTSLQGVVRSVWESEAKASVGRLSFSSDGSALAAGLVDGRVIVGRSGAAVPEQQWKGPNGSSNVLAWSTDSSMIFVAGLDGRVRGYARAPGEPSVSVDAPASVSLAMEVLRDRLVLYDAWASHAWTLATRTSAEPLPANTRVRVHAWMEDGLWMGESGNAALHRLKDGPRVRVGLDPVAPLMKLLADDRGGRWTLHADGTVARFVTDAAGTWTQTDVWNHAEATGVALAVCPGTGWIAAYRSGGAIAIWRPEDADAQTLEGHDQPLMSLVCARDGRTLVSADFGGRVLRWDLGEPTRGPQLLAAFEGVAFELAFVPGTDALVLAGQTGLWHWPDVLVPGAVPEAWSDLAHHQLSVSPSRIAALRQDGSVAIHEPQGALWVEFRNFGGREIRAIALAPDGRRLALMGPARIWELDFWTR